MHVARIGHARQHLIGIDGGPDADPAVVPWVCEVLRGIGREPVVIDRWKMRRTSP